MAHENLYPISRRNYHPGKPLWYRILWILVESATLLNPLFLSSTLKVKTLRWFGATIGENAIIKPNVHVKHPWCLNAGDNLRLGERAWIDNLVQVTIGDQVRISQGAYLCTGNHDWSDPAFGMIPEPIEIGSRAWIGAFAKVGPGVKIGEEAIVTIGSVLLKDAERGVVYQGNPAAKIRKRTIRDVPGPKQV